MSSRTATPEIRRAQGRKAISMRFYGPDDPRTIAAARELVEAKIRAAEAEAARLRELLAAMPTGQAA
jgi:hypothetical protein